MNKNICRALVLGASLAMASACSSSTASDSGTSSAVTQLFTLEPTPDRSTLQKTATGYLATLLADPANQEITLVKVDPAVVSNKTQDLAVTLPNGKTAQFHLRDYNTITPGIDGWVGYKPSAWKQAHPSSASEIDYDPLYFLSLAREGEKLVGSVTVEGQAYRIDYVSPGQHALIKVDESKLPPEGDPLEIPGTAANDDTVGKAPKATQSTIRVLFVTTKQLRAKRPNNRLELASALINANEYMRNSQVSISYELAGFFDADYDETGRTYKQQLDDIRLAKPFGEQVLELREARRADLVSMYSTNPEFCGQAWVTASKLQGHSVITCASSLAHELGHNLGATHNWQEGDAVRNPPYMHGYRQMAVTPKFHTQMSYECGSDCPQIAYHSNPRLTYQGLPLGTVGHHDVARRFNERRETVENFYPPMPFKKIKNVMREASGVPACLMVTTRGDLGFTDCEGSSNDLSRRQWLYNSISPAISIESRLGGDAACLQYTRNGGAPQLSGCPADISEAIKTHTAWYLILGTIQYNFLGISNCLTAGAGDTSPVFDFCKGGFDQQWRAVD